MEVEGAVAEGVEEAPRMMCHSTSRHSRHIPRQRMGRLFVLRAHSDRRQSAEAAACRMMCHSTSRHLKHIPHQRMGRLFVLPEHWGTHQPVVEVEAAEVEAAEASSGKSLRYQ